MLGSCIKLYPIQGAWLSVKQACYELRASNIYHEISPTPLKHQLRDDEYILIKPNQTIVVITMEKVCLQSDILGRILSKGKLFSIGLLPVNTYADPGFYGKLGIVFHNASTHYLKFLPGEPIAKIEFSRLEHAVVQEYHGQHGYETNIWPIPEDMILSEEEIKKDPRILSPTAELILSHGRTFGQITNKVFSYERRLLLASFAFVLLSLVVILATQTNEWFAIVVGFVVSVLASIAVILLVHLATNLRR